MRIRRLDPDKKEDVNSFVDFPFALYQNCSQWVPPLRSSAKTILNPAKHPFYDHSEADFFVAESEGQVLGRIAALNNRNYNAYHQNCTAFFGYFEVIEEASVAQTLFDTALAWAKTRDLTEIIGPRGVIGVDGSVLVEGFEHRPALGIPYNYAYYDELIKLAGFEKDTDYLSGYRWVKQPLPPRLYELAQKIMARRDFWVKTFRSKAELKSWLPRLIDLHHHAFSQLHSYYPPTRAEVAMVSDTLLTIADPKLIKLVMKRDEPIGFILAYHDISAALQKTKGRMWPLGWLHLLRERQQTTWLNVNAIGLLPTYRGVGANVILYTELGQTLKAFDHLSHLDMVQIEEKNFNSYADMEHIGVTWYKRHRHYRRSV